MAAELAMDFKSEESSTMGEIKGYIQSMCFGIAELFAGIGGLTCGFGMLIILNLSCSMIWTQQPDKLS